MVWKPSTWDPWDVGIDKGIGERAETESLEAIPAKYVDAHRLVECHGEPYLVPETISYAGDNL